MILKYRKGVIHMKREQWNTREKRREAERNTNQLAELLKILNHFFPDLRIQLLNVKDPRKKNYTTYETDVILLERILAYIFGVSSMNEITERFNTEEALANFVLLARRHKLSSLPHGDTVNDFLEELEPEEIEKIRNNMVKRLIKMRCFDEYKYLGKYWKLIFDGSGIYKFDKRHCPHCLTKTYNKGTENEKTEYFHYVLECKLVVGEMAISLATEFIENPEENIEKQDCELRAFYRLEKKVKEKYPRLPICVLLDSEYACQQVLEICRKNKWEYIIRFKAGSIPTVAEEFEKLKEYDKNITIEENGKIYRYVNDIEYKGYKVNVIEMEEPEKKYPFRIYGEEKSKYR